MDTDVYAGELLINGSVRTNRIRAWFFGDRIVISDGTKDFHSNVKLTLSPVTHSMLLQSNPVEKCGPFRSSLSGRAISVTGHRLGQFEDGPQGHPGDGEFDVRPVGEFHLSTELTRRSLKLQIEGVSREGYFVCYFAAAIERTGLEPWRFCVSFDVPLEHLQAFLKLDENQFSKLMGDAAR